MNLTIPVDSILPRALSRGVSSEYQLTLAEEIFGIDGTDSEGRDMIDSLALRVAEGELSAANIMDVLYRCGRCGASEACSLVIQRSIDHTSRTDATQLQGEFIPLLSPIRNFSLSYPHLGNTGVNALLQSIIKRWIEMVLGQRPTQDPSASISFTWWTCNCDPCQSTKSLLTNPSIDRTSLVLDPLHASSGRHLEEFLKLCAPGTATVTVNNARTPSLVVRGFPTILISDTMRFLNKFTFCYLLSIIHR